MAGKTWHSLPEYQALRAMMEAGTTSQAAVRLGLSQSAVSRSLSSLEARTGTILFERDSGRLRATSEAVLLNKRLDALFEALDRIDGPSQPTRETLRLIAPPSYAHRFLVTQLSNFLKANPNFFVSMEVASSVDVIRGIMDEKFDLGISGVELSHEGVRLQPYRVSSAVCAMPPDHPLAQRDHIMPIDLHGQNLIALTHRHARRSQLEKELNEHHSSPHIVAEVSTSFAAIDLAREGLGLAIINPFPVVHYRAADIAIRPFVSQMQYRSYFVASDHNPLSSVARAFIRHLRLHTPSDPFSLKA